MNDKWELFAKENGLKLDWDSPINIGDLYLAKRNTGFKLLTAKKIVDNYVIPVENEYCYDIWECCKVIK